MKRVVWSFSAREDLREITTYIAADNPFAARRVQNRLQQAVLALADRPTGRVGRVDGTFEKVVQGLPFIIAYQVGHLPGERQEIVITRIIHTARDWTSDEWPE